MISHSMDQITKDTNPDPEFLNELLFADDQVIMNGDEAHLQEHTSNFKQRLRKRWHEDQHQQDGGYVRKKNT